MFGSDVVYPEREGHAGRRFSVTLTAASDYTYDVKSTDRRKEERMIEMEILFPGGKRVNSRCKRFLLPTDQPKDEGGDNAAPELYDLFLSAIGTCAGVYLLYFCQERGIDTTGLKMSLEAEKNGKNHLFETIRIQISLPPGFTEKYRAAVARAAGM